MTENNMNDAESRKLPVGDATVPNLDPVDVARLLSSADSAKSRDKSRKKTSPKARRVPKDSPSSRRGEDSAKRSGGAVRKRRNFIVGFVAVIVIFDITVLSVFFFSGFGPSAPPNNNPVALIQEQLPIENTIPEIGYDSSLTFANHTGLTIANTSSMKPINNNLLKKGGKADGGDLLYDALIVNRVLRLNTDWIDYLNQGNQRVFDSLSSDPNSPAKDKLIELGGNSQIAFSRIALGEIRHIGSRYYILAEVSYVLVHDGEREVYDDLFAYELVRNGSTMVVANFERIPRGQVTSDSEQTLPEETSESLEGVSEGVSEEFPEEQPENATEEQSEASEE